MPAGFPFLSSASHGQTLCRGQLAAMSVPPPAALEVTRADREGAESHRESSQGGEEVCEWMCWSRMNMRERQRQRQKQERSLLDSDGFSAHSSVPRVPAVCDEHPASPAFLLRPPCISQGATSLVPIAHALPPASLPAASGAGLSAHAERFPAPLSSCNVLSILMD